MGIYRRQIFETLGLHHAENIDIQVSQHLAERTGFVMFEDELKPGR